MVVRKLEQVHEILMTKTLNLDIIIGTKSMTMDIIFEEIVSTNFTEEDILI